MLYFRSWFTSVGVFGCTVLRKSWQSWVTTGITLCLNCRSLNSGTTQIQTNSDKTLAICHASYLLSETQKPSWPNNTVYFAIGTHSGKFPYPNSGNEGIGTGRDIYTGGNKSFSFLIFHLLIFFRKREKNEKGEKERNINLLFHLLMHSLVAFCMCPDWGSNLQSWCIRTTL